LQLELIETVDIVATMGASKRPGQFVVGFALETEDRRFRALAKLQRKSCDLIVSNSEAAIDAESTSVEVLSPDGETVALANGTKQEVAAAIMQVIHQRLLRNK
jgi:phosphopantothenoylcysteine decarboxylase/phosphopantothenate--cysteine ligase